MLRLFLSGLGFGLLGLVVVPLIAFLGALALFHVAVPQCGSPGDSGGCEMSAGVIGLMSVAPGFLIGVAFAIYRARRRSRAPIQETPAAASSTGRSGTDEGAS